MLRNLDKLKYFYASPINAIMRLFIIFILLFSSCTWASDSETKNAAGLERAKQDAISKMSDAELETIAAKKKKKNLSIKDIESVENIESLKDSLSKAMIDVKERSKIFYSQCFKAFGHGKFCNCITEKTPFSISFLYYVAITSGEIDKTEIDPIIIKRTIEARETCVGLL